MTFCGTLKVAEAIWLGNAVLDSRPRCVLNERLHVVVNCTWYEMSLVPCASF